jgi:hypothetical protein
MAHALALRGRRAGDEADHRLLHVLALMNSAASSSALPPISPTMMMPFGLRIVLGTASGSR